MPTLLPDPSFEMADLLQRIESRKVIQWGSNSFLTALAATAVLACDSGLVVDPFAFATVYGEVSAGTTDEPVADVEESGAAAEDDCELALEVLPGLETTTDADGRYTLGLNRLGSGFTACVALFLEPPAGSGLRADTVLIEDVRFGEERTDSVRVDIVLEEAAGDMAAAWERLAE